MDTINIENIKTNIKENIWTYIIIIIIIIFFICIIYNIKNKKNIENIKLINIIEIEKDNEEHNIVIDEQNIYVINSNKITKYNKNGDRIKSKKYKVHNLKGGKVINGDLYVCISNNYENSVLGINRETLDIEDNKELPYLEGQILLWIDHNMGKWWLCCKNKEKNFIYCFNDNWEIEGLWKIPKHIATNISEGRWVNNQLYLLDSDTKNLLITILPDDEIDIELIDIKKNNNTGISFDLEKKSNKKIKVWCDNGSNIIASFYYKIES